MSPNVLKCITALAFVVFLASCAGGRDFDRPAPDSLVVGETTKSEVRARYGEPWKTRSNKVNEHSIENLVYAYSDGGDAGSPWRVMNSCLAMGGTGSAFR